MAFVLLRNLRACGILAGSYLGNGKSASSHLSHCSFTDVGIFYYEVNSINFSPDGRYVVTGSADHTARVWDIETGEELARMTHDDQVITAVFSSDSKFVVSTSWDDTARAWEYLPEDLIVTACSYALRNLSRTEWKAFIGDALSYQAVCPNLPIEPEPQHIP